MTLIADVLAHLGVLTFTLLSIALILYLVRTMLHPESY